MIKRMRKAGSVYNKKDDLVMIRKSAPYRKGVCYIFSTYWLILVLWQNAGGASLRGSVDTLVKVALLLFLALKFIEKSRHIRRVNFLFIIAFFVSQMVTFVANDAGNINLSTIIYYVFPALFVFLTLGIGSEFCVQEDEVEVMNSLVIMVCLYAILYTLIFEPGQFVAAFLSKSGYGSELHAFFTSMNEFAMYLFYGIVSCMMKIEKLKSSSKRIPYYCMAILFFGTQILTFSRTAILGTLSFLIVYSFFFNSSKLSRKIRIGMVLAVVMILLISPLREYLFRTVFKSGKSGSRMKLFPLAIDFFSNGTLFQKLFGNGINATRSYFVTELTYGSVHNGYLQVLLYYGIVGLAFLGAFLINQAIEAIKIFRKDKFVSVLSMAMLSYAVLTMLPTTLIIFNSSIDCFFLTSMLIIIPKYMRNAVYRGKFYRE